MDDSTKIQKIDKLSSSDETGTSLNSLFATVIEPIVPGKPGIVLYQALQWRAVSISPVTVQVGDKVKLIGRRGNTWLIESITLSQNSQSASSEIPHISSVRPQVVKVSGRSPTVPTVPTVPIKLAAHQKRSSSHNKVSHLLVEKLSYAATEAYEFIVGIPKNLLKVQQASKDDNVESEDYFKIAVDSTIESLGEMDARIEKIQNETLALKEESRELLSDLQRVVVEL